MELQFSDLLGKVLLVGLTYYTHDHVFVEQKQFFGKVISADERGVTVEKPDGTLLNLPPDLRSTKIAPPGEYRLRSTGEVVVDPDFLATWNVTLPEKKPEQKQ